MSIATRYRSRSGFGASAPYHVLGTRFSSYTPIGNYVIYSPYRETCADALHSGPPFRSGGALILQRARYTHYPSNEVKLWNSLGAGYEGRFASNEFGQNPESSGSGPGLYTEAQVLPLHDTDGATAWNRAKPGNPGSDGAQLFAELHRIPTIPALKAGVRFYKNLGQNYLNVEFGWKPFMNTYNDVIKTSHLLHHRLMQLRRDNGRSIRRKLTLEDYRSEETTTETESGYPILTSGFYQNASIPGTRTVTIERTRRRWFSGAFRYWIPDIESPEGNLRIMRKIYGSDLTPALVWELTPWSWLVDWFTNVGDVISNASGNAAENLVGLYAYNMSHYTRRDYVRGTLNLRGSEVAGGPIKNLSVSFQAELERTLKLRNTANPFGFGVTFGDLSDRQLAILGALGLARH